MNDSEVRDRQPEAGDTNTPDLNFFRTPLRVAVWCSIVIGLMMMANRGHADEGQRQTVLFLAEEGPLVMEFQITVDEKPFAEVWEAGLAKLFHELDRDDNGLLSRQETEIPPKEKKAEHPTTLSPAAMELLQVAHLWDADAEPRDAQLSLKEIRRFLSGRDEGPFQTEAAKGSAGLLSPQVTQTNNAGERLWSWLDEDQNAKLSGDELRNAGAMLRKYDLDADESISLNELQAIDNPFFNVRRSNQKTDTPFFAVSQHQSSTPLIRRLIQRYGKRKPSSSQPSASQEKPPKSESKPPQPAGLDVNLLKLPEDQQEQFDRDRNGILDHWELRAYLKNPVPMVTIQVELPMSETSAPQLSGRVAVGKRPIVVKKSAGGAVSVLTGEIQIEIDATGLKPETLLQSMEERFRQRDRNNNGYLEPPEVLNDDLFRRLFGKYDANDDDKLYPDEWKPPVTAAIHTASMRTRIEVQDGGKDVFSVLDTDRNLQISPREWVTAADRLSVWDKNENATLEKSEVPHVYRVSFGRGLPDLPGLIAPQNTNQTPTMQQLVRGPKWFQAMDKNGDGDVSAREFLGKPEVFQTIDQDKNRLIDPREATQFSESK